MPSLMDILGFAGDVMDTPGRLTRTALAGRNPLDALFDPSQGVSGRDLLQQYGMVGENQDGLDAGDVGGFAAEMALDPTNLLGGGLLAKLLGKAGKAKTVNLARKAQLAHNQSAAFDNAILDMQANLSQSGADLARSQAAHAGRLPRLTEAESIARRLDQIPPERRAMMLTQWNNPPSEMDQLDFAFGDRDQAAAAAARGFGVELQPAHPAAAAMGRGGEFNVYGFHAPVMDPKLRVLNERPISATGLRNDFTEEAFKGLRDGWPEPLTDIEKAVASGKMPQERFVDIGNRGVKIDAPPPQQGRGFRMREGSLIHDASQLGGFVPVGRPDVVFDANSATNVLDPIMRIGIHDPHTLNHILNGATHEPLHAMAELHPDQYAKMKAALGADMPVAALERRLGKEGALYYQLQNMLGAREEGIATMFGESAQHGASRQRFPFIDAVMQNSPRETSADPGLVNEVADLLKQRYPKANQSGTKEAAQLFLDFLQGNARKRNALVPVGEASSRTVPPRSFSVGAKYPQMPFPGEYRPLLPVFNQAEEPPTSSLLAALLGHNAVARSNGAN